MADSETVASAGSTCWRESIIVDIAEVSYLGQEDFPTASPGLHPNETPYQRC
jgi:hypothetical protein